MNLRKDHYRNTMYVYTFTVVRMLVTMLSRTTRKVLRRFVLIEDAAIGGAGDGASPELARSARQGFFPQEKKFGSLGSSGLNGEQRRRLHAVETSPRVFFSGNFFLFSIEPLSKNTLVGCRGNSVVLRCQATSLVLPLPALVTKNEIYKNYSRRWITRLVCR